MTRTSPSLATTMLPFCVHSGAARFSNGVHIFLERVICWLCASVLFVPSFTGALKAQSPCDEFVAFGPDTDFVVTFEVAYEYAIIADTQSCNDVTQWTAMDYLVWWECTDTALTSPPFKLCACNAWGGLIAGVAEDCWGVVYAWPDSAVTVMYCPATVSSESSWSMNVSGAAPFPSVQDFDPYETWNDCQRAQWADVPLDQVFFEGDCLPGVPDPGEGFDVCYNANSGKCRITVEPSDFISCTELTAKHYFELIGFDPGAFGAKETYTEAVCCFLEAKARGCAELALADWLIELLELYRDYFEGETVSLDDLLAWLDCAINAQQIALSEHQTQATGAPTEDGKPLDCDNEMLSDNPVHVSRGYKLESVVDASLPLPGGPLTIVRDYSSQHNYTGANIVGRNWTASPFWFIHEVDEMPGWVPWCDTPPVHNQVPYFKHTDLYYPAAATNLFMKSTTLTVDGVPYTVWRQTEPGEWEIDYLASGGTNVAPHEVGLMKQRRDMYGNTWTYNYTDFGSLPAVARLTSIDCRNASDPAAPDAQVRFLWNTSDQFGLDGTLNAIQIVRFLSSGTAVQTHLIQYTYEADGDPDQLHSDELGTPGDLVQVTVRERIDGTAETGGPVDRVRITQYRYHDSSVTNRSNIDGRLTVVGKNHQLKMIIEPEQIEAFAEEFGYADMEDAAAALLLLDDDNELGITGSPRVVDLASKIVAYEEAGSKVSREYVQAGCGCGASSGESQRFEFTYYDPTAGSVNTTRLREYVGGSSSVYRYQFYDWKVIGSLAPTPYLSRYALIEPGASGGPDGRMWVTGYEYNTLGELTSVAMPSAMSSYSVGTETTEATYEPSANLGLAYAYTYSDHRLQSQRVREGHDSNPDNYLKLWDCDFDVNRPWLMTALRRYRTESGTPGADDIETTFFAYGFHAGDAINWSKMTTEAEAPAENGPTGTSGVYESAELYDALGNNTWSLAADGSLTKRIFSDAGVYQPAGKALSVIRNSDTTGLPSGAGDKPTLSNNDWNGRNADGGSLTTQYKYDLAGRIRAITLPGDVSTYTYRVLLPFAGRDTLAAYYAVLVLPAKSGSVENGPAAITWFNAGGSVIGTSEYEIADIGSYEPSLGDYSLGTQLSRSEIDHSLSGLVETTFAWWDTGHSPEISAYEYDDLGRPKLITDANGTITELHAYDVLDRVLEVRTGTNEQSLATVAQFFYDWNHTGTPAQGQGDGNLTLSRLFTGETSGGNPVVRDTETYFDYRSRPVKTIAPLPPHEIVAYDNLDRVTKRAIFRIEPAAIDQDLSDRGLYSEQHYSQRGLPIRDSIATDPTAPTPEFLESNRWFDPAGRPVVAWDPNGPIVKTDYDGLGRVKARFVTHDNDLYTYGPGRNGSPPIDNKGEVGGSITADQVIEQTEYVYDDSSTPRGTLDLVVNRHRLHDAGPGTVGALTAGNSVPLSAGFYYDAFRRRIRTLNFGVGDNFSENVLRKGALIPQDWPPSSPPNYGDTEWLNYIIEATSYNARGLVDTQTDSEGSQTRFAYDMFGRRVAVVENYDDTSALDIAWSGLLDRWEVTGIGTEDDVNRTTTFVYDGVGNIRKQVAHLPQTADPNDSEVQETAYVYAASTAGGSLVDSNSLLSEVRYPDESTGLAGTSRALKVLYTYDRLGDLRSVEDQNQTRHTYTRDGEGRVTLDAVSLAQGSAIDDWVLSMGVAYDDFGRLRRVTSYTDALGSTVKNQAELAYSPLWQIMHVYQDHDGAVTYDGSGVPTGNTRRVQYSYNSAVVDAGNRSRLSSLTYPDGSIFNHAYGSTAGDIDDHISRLTRMKINGEAADLVAYEHVGLGMVAAVDYPTADIQLDRTVSHAGYRRTQGYQTQPEGWYPGWDRFGRVKKHAWVDGAYTSGLGGNPSVPPLVEVDYTHDRASNRLSMSDARPGASWSDRDFAYSYDGLDRLAQADRGAAGGSWSAAVGGQKWALDMLGNWETLWRDADGDGVYESTEDQTRTHNAANELEELTPVTGPPALPFAYDEAGNMTESPNQSGSATMYYKHDAWNRLTEVKVGATPLGEYEYNALHWRTVKRSRDPVVGGPGLDEMRLMYYSANWQLLEERIDRSWTSGFTEDERAQTFWGKRYIDDAVLRRRDRDVNGTYEHAFHYLSDAQFSTVAMVDSSNARVVERNSYDAYGKARHHFGGDVNNDAAATNADDNAIVATMNAGTNSIGQVNYKVEQDLNRDGLINLNDRLTLQALTGNSVQPALASGQVSFRSTGSGASIIHGPDNPIAWDGYVFNPETLQYTVRFRWYDPSLGRWLERDPVGYVGEQNLYGYVLASPASLQDPLGLFPHPSWPHAACCAMRPNYCSEEVFIAFGKMAQQLDWELATLVSERYTLLKNPHPEDIPAGYAEQLDAEIEYRQQLWTELEAAFEELGCTRGISGMVFIYDMFSYRFYEGTLEGAMQGANEIGQQLWHGGDLTDDFLFFDIVLSLIPGGGAAVPVRVSITKTATRGGALVCANRVRGLGFQELSRVSGGFSTKTKAIESISGSARYRLPDFFDDIAKIIGDAKCVSKLYKTPQISDLANWAKLHGFGCQIWIPEGAKVSRSIQRMIDEGLITIRHPNP